MVELDLWHLRSLTDCLSCWETGRMAQVSVHTPLPFSPNSSLYFWYFIHWISGLSYLSVTGKRKKNNCLRFNNSKCLLCFIFKFPIFFLFTGVQILIGQSLAINRVPLLSWKYHTVIAYIHWVLVSKWIIHVWHGVPSP